MRTLLSCLFLMGATAQAVQPGDLIATGINTDGTGEVSLLALATIPGGTELFVTDNGWLDSQVFRAHESSDSFTLISDVEPGMAVFMDFAAGEITIDGETPLTINAVPSLSNDGDQVFVYTMQDDEPQFICAIATKQWLTSPGPTVTSNTSYLPPALQDTAFAVVPTTKDNAAYDCTSGVSGTASELAALLANPANYTVDNSNALPLPPTCAWDFVSEAGPSLLDTFTAASLDGWDTPASDASSGDDGIDGGFITATDSSGTWVLHNNIQWSGDWTALGYTDVYFHVRAHTALTLRLVVEDSDGSSDAITTQGATIPADGAWHRVHFTVSAADLTLLTDASAADILADVGALSIVVADGLDGPSVFVGGLDLDNISTQPLANLCGDSVAEGSEVCDGGDLAQADCTDLGYTDPGVVSCSATCDEVVYSECVAECGDFNVEPGEFCDEGGVDTLTCDADCTEVEDGDGICNAVAEDPINNPVDCADTCGDDLASGPEDCDGADLSNTSCIDLGYTGGALACDNSCVFDTSGCTTECGNSVVEPGEACDTGGSSDTCTAVCTLPMCGDGECTTAASEDPATCPQDCGPVCGDGLVTHTEVCDGVNLGGVTCMDSGYSTPAGAVCASTCDSIDISACSATCGDGVLEPGEQCDDGNTAAQDGCDPICVPEPGYECDADNGCRPECGDGVVIGDEECDDGNTDEGDGCASDCIVEDFFVCDDTEPSVCAEDSDGDGIADDVDNCPDDANPAQEDSDGNGVGDACEEADTEPDTDTDPLVDTADTGLDTGVGKARCGCEVTGMSASWLAIGLIPLLARRRRALA